MLTRLETDGAAPDALEETRPRIQGRVEGCRQGVVHGWAWRTDAPGDKCVIDILVAGAVVGDGIACLPCADSEASGAGHGGVGFAVRFDAAFLSAAPEDFEATVRVRGESAPLANGALRLGRAALAGIQATPPGQEIWPPPPYALQAAGLRGLLDRLGPDHVEGWGQDGSAPSSPLTLHLWEGEQDCGAVTGRIWRKDLEELRQGDGRWGMKAPVPAGLADGRIHVLTLRLPDGTPACPGTITTRFARGQGDTAPPPPRNPDREPTSTRIRPERTDAPADTMFSIVVVFYNMTREAARTLHSLSRAYQRGLGALRYEVLVVDNGSDPPLEAEWVRGFGPEFRLIRPRRRASSPCPAINEAAAETQGRYVAVMIDGAHILTPGALREAWDAVTDTPEAVVGLRQWFVGGDQRWLARCGYTRAQEDMLFDRIAWPEDGYSLFFVSAPIWEGPNHWFDGMIESNCLFVPRGIWERIGGMDEQFDEAGAGYANLDLFRRAADASPEPVVALVGEATFHQFHEGTTTNVTRETKENRVRAYENKYALLKGRGFAGVSPVDLRVRGQLHTESSVVARQRPLSRVKIGVTDEVRPGEPALHFDVQAQAYLQSTYVELGLHHRTTWLGETLDMAPSDAMTIQELIVQLRPERIVTVNACRGLLLLADSVLRLCGEARSRILAAGTRAAGPLPDSVRVIGGGAEDPDTLARVAAALDLAERVLVIFTPAPGDRIPASALLAYARFVTLRSYLVFNGTALGQPWLGYSVRWFERAVNTLAEQAPFAVDPARNPHLITTSPMGYLQRVGPVERLSPLEGGSPPTGLD